MAFTTWLRGGRLPPQGTEKGRQHRAARPQRRSRFRPLLEQLEVRVVPAFVITPTFAPTS